MRKRNIAGSVCTMVEGVVETEIDGCHVLMVAAGGVFRGSVDVERADINGTVEGSLTVLQILTVRASGRIIGGAVSYGELEGERSAMLIGTVEVAPQNRPGP